MIKKSTTQHSEIRIYSPVFRILKFIITALFFFTFFFTFLCLSVSFMLKKGKVVLSGKYCKISLLFFFYLCKKLKCRFFFFNRTLKQIPFTILWILLLETSLLLPWSVSIRPFKMQLNMYLKYRLAMKFI